MNLFTYSHMRKCFLIGKMFIECHSFYTDNYLSNDFLIIIAYFFFERYEPSQYTKLYRELLLLNKLDRIEYFKKLFYDDYFFNKFMKIMEEIKNEK